MLARSFFRTDWTKPKFDVSKPYTEHRVLFGDNLKEGKGRTKTPFEKKSVSNAKGAVSKNKSRNFTTLSCETPALNPTSRKSVGSANTENIKSILNLERLLLPPMATISYLVIRDFKMVQMDKECCVI